MARFMARSLRLSIAKCWQEDTCSFPRWMSSPRFSSTSTSDGEPLTITTQKNGIRKIFLNDPKKRNALSLAMIKSLTNDLLHKSDDPDLRVVIISAGGPVFCAGHDLKELTSETGRDYHKRVFDSCSEMMLVIGDMPVPVIAQVQGLATAAGCQLVATCDLAVASEKARFATPGASVGLFCSTPAVAVGRAVPHKLAMEMLFTGEPISSEVALQNGLINRIVAEDELEDETQVLAEKICRFSRSVLALGKAAFNSQIVKDRPEAYTETGAVMVDNLCLADGQEGIDAFIRKRKPTWKHTFDKVHE